MKDFTVVFIANCHLDEEDSCDFKEWKTVRAKNANDAMGSMSKHAMVLECYED